MGEEVEFGEVGEVEKKENESSVGKLELATGGHDRLGVNGEGTTELDPGVVGELHAPVFEDIPIGRFETTV